MNGKKLSHKEKLKAKTKSGAAAASPSADASMLKLKRQLAIALAVIAAALYLNTINHGFNLDDTSAITENWVVKQGVEGIPTIFKTPYRYGYWVSEDELYRPVPLALFAALWQIFPNNPLPGHLLNILLYALTAYFLFMLLARLMKSYNIVLPFIAVLFFIVHPLHTEVVANIKSMDEIISFLLALVSLKLILDYLEQKKFKQILLAMVCFLVAYLSKEGTITMLAIIPLSIYFFTNIPRNKILTASAWLLIPTFIYLGIRASVLGDLTGGKKFAMIDNVLMGAHNVGERWATAFKILGKYFLMLIYPNPLSSDYSYKQFTLNGWNNPWAILTFFICLGLLVYGIIGLRKKKIFAFSALFFLISISLYSNLFVVIGSAFAERFLYVGVLGFTLALAWVLMKAARISPAPQDAASVKKSIGNQKLIMLSLVLFVPFSIRTVTRNPDWKTYLTLYAADTKNTPDCARMHFFLGNEIQKEKAKKTEDKQEKIMYLDSAIHEYTRAVTLYPGYADAYGQMAMAYMLRGNDSMAFQLYNKSLQLNTTMAMNYSNFGMYFFNRGDYKTALDLYTRAINLNPRYADGWRNLGSTYGQMKEYEKAVDAFKKSLKYEPDNADVMYFLGITYRSLNQPDLAETYINKAKKLGKK
jgi:hypothetical protein